MLKETEQPKQSLAATIGEAIEKNEQSNMGRSDSVAAAETEADPTPITFASSTDSELKCLQKIYRVMSRIGAIAKKHRNEFQKYDYRGIDDVLNNLQPLLVKEGLLIIPTVTASDYTPKDKGRNCRLTIDYKFVDVESGGSYTATGFIGEGDDSGDKATGKAFSSAYKTMAFNVFCIPTSESTDIEAEPGTAAAKQARTQSQPNSRPAATVQPVSQQRSAPPPAATQPAPTDEMKTPLSQKGWDKIYGLMDKLEIVGDNARHTALVVGVRNLGIQPPTNMRDLPIHYGKLLFQQFEADLKAKDDFLANPNPEAEDDGFGNYN